jgi:DNA-directed RNA polymerase subunit L
MSKTKKSQAASAVQGASLGSIDIKIDSYEKTEFKPDYIKDNKTYAPQSSSLKLILSGDDATLIFANTVRRIALDNIPSYAFCSDSIIIEENTSIFNNDQLRLRWSQLPIFDVETDISFLHPKYWKVDYSDPNREKHPLDTISIQLFLNIQNTTNANMNVTTDHIKYYVDGELVDNPYKKSGQILLIQLRPTEKIITTMTGVLGVGEKNNIWSALSTGFYDDETPNKVGLTIESSGQQDEMAILLKVCQNATQKLGHIEKIVMENYDLPSVKNEQNLLIKIDDENHTFGNIINDQLQNHKNVEYCGLAKPDQLVKQIEIKLCTSTQNPLTIFSEVITRLIKMFNTFEKSLKDLKYDNKNKKLK